VQVLVRDNNVDQALKALKKKMQREGIFREMKLRGHYEKPSEKKAREKAEAIRRARKLARKRMQREGLLPMKPRPTTGPGAGPARGPRRPTFWSASAPAGARSRMTSMQRGPYGARAVVFGQPGGTLLSASLSQRQDRRAVRGGQDETQHGSNPHHPRRQPHPARGIA
jgi:small subunit ribosomal protein S21